MKKSKNEQVQEFLEKIMMADDEKFKMLQKMRKIVFINAQKPGERMMYGGIMFSLEEDFGGLFVRKNHISFEFGNGSEMEDPEKWLEGTGKSRRHLKIRSVADIAAKEVEFFVRQAVQQ